MWFFDVFWYCQVQKGILNLKNWHEHAPKGQKSKVSKLICRQIQLKKGHICNDFAAFMTFSNLNQANFFFIQADRRQGPQWLRFLNTWPKKPNCKPYQLLDLSQFWLLRPHNSKYSVIFGLFWCQKVQIFVVLIPSDMIKCKEVRKA